MRRRRTTWLIFAGALLAAGLTVGWLTQGVLKAERLAHQMQQQALFDSNLRLALWRLDSVASPLIAVETMQSNFFPPNPQSPRLAARLVKGTADFGVTGEWFISAPDYDEQLASKLKEHSALFKSLPVAGASPASGDGPLTANVVASSPLAQFIEWPMQSATGGPTGNSSTQTQGPLKPLPPFGNLVQPQKKDYDVRNQLTQQVQQFAVGALNQQGQQQQNATLSSRSKPAIPMTAPVGAFAPLWVADELVLARRISWQNNSTSVIECRILDWPEWQALLTSQVTDLFPDAQLVPVSEEALKSPATAALFDTRLQSLPVRLVPHEKLIESDWPRSVVVAWGLLVLAALAVGWLLWQTQSLSERRAAFVSAVTHELRTPLTTFRLYTEMLSDGLVPDVEQQQTYFRTLSREANRLTHLVENVLSFARLERGRTTARNETLTLGAIFDRCEPRLAQRVAETALQWTPEIAPTAREVALTTNVTAIEQVLFNLVDNACKYAAEATDPRLLFNATASANEVIFSVRDFGPGLSDSARRTLFAAFEKSSAQAAESAPGIGLGLSLSKRLARDLGGDLKLRDTASLGVLFELCLPPG